jgi:hypothetical protein
MYGNLDDTEAKISKKFKLSSIGLSIVLLTVSITQFENNKQNKNANILNFKLKCAYIFISSFFRLYLFSKTLLVVARSKVQNRVTV